MATLTALLTACDSDSGYNEREDFEVGEGSVQFVNMMPDSMIVTVLHGLQNSAVRFPYAEAPEPRFEDRYDWRIAYLNNSNDDVTVIEGENQQITENVLSTFLFFGTLTNPRVEIIDTPDIAPADRPEGIASIWFASNLTGYDMVDVYLTDLDADLTTAAPLLSLTTGTFTPLFEVAAGDEKQLRIMIAGTDNLLFDSGSIVIPERSQELFALVDDFGPDSANHVNVIRSLSFSRSIIRDNSQTSSVRIGNFSSIAELDATFGDASRSNVAPGARTAYFDTGRGELAYVTSNDDTVLEETSHTVFAGQFSTIFNFNDLREDAPGPVRSVNVPDNRRPVAKRALLKFVNGGDNPIDVYVLRSGQTVSNSRPFVSEAPFAGTSETEIVPVNLNFVVRDAGTDEELARISSALAEGSTYSLVFTAEQELLLLED